MKLKYYDITLVLVILTCTFNGCKEKAYQSKPYTPEELYGQLDQEKTLTLERKTYLLERVNEYKYKKPPEEENRPEGIPPGIKGIDDLYYILLEIIEFQNVELLNALEESQISLTDRRATMVLYSVLERGEIASVNYLLSKNILGDKNTANAAIFRAACAKKNRPEMIRLIFKAGIDDVNMCEWEGESLLHWVSFRGYVDSIETLLLLGADVNLKDSFFQHTSLHVAARYGQYEVAKVLLENGADFRMKDKVGNTPLDKALESAEPGRESPIGKRKIANLIREYMSKE